MCLAYPGKIVTIENMRAVVDFDGIEKKVNISLVPDVGIGDFVIVHAGFAIQILSSEDALAVLQEYEKAQKNS